jgi:chromosome segregation ATPase
MVKKNTMDKETKEEFENLARMVQNGFLELKGEITSVRTELKEDISVLDTKVTELDVKVSELDVKVSELDVKVSELDVKVSELDVKVSRIDRRTESQADSLYEDMHELKDRVVVVEKKNGIAPPKPKFVAA